MERGATLSVKPSKIIEFETIPAQKQSFVEPSSNSKRKVSQLEEKRYHIKDQANNLQDGQIAIVETDEFGKSM